MNKIIKQVVEQDMMNKYRYSRNARRILNEDDNMSSVNDKMSSEELKVESLKIATNIAKLMADVTPDDIIKISEKVSDFIRNYNMKASDVEKPEDNDKEGEQESLETPLNNPSEK